MRKTIFCLAILFVALTACDNKQTKDCSSETAGLEAKISALNDTITMLRAGSMAQNTAIEDGTATDSEGKTGNGNTGGVRYYKTGYKYTHAASTGIPGWFPEGSERLLKERDLKFLSEWGLKVMENEIYARHGMIFGDETLNAHFRSQGWYKARSQGIPSDLSRIERQNVQLIKAYKFSPDIPA